MYWSIYMPMETYVHLRLEEVGDILTGISGMVVNARLDAQIHAHVDQLGERREGSIR